MTPDFLVGDLIVIDPKVRPLPGEFVLARSGETTLFRKFKANELDLGNEQSFSLIPLMMIMLRCRLVIMKLR